jgi:hypothetical protein
MNKTHMDKLEELKVQKYKQQCTAKLTQLIARRAVD